MATKEKQKSRQNSFANAPKEEAAKLERIVGHTTGLVDDLKSWFELKIEFVLLEFKEDLKSTGKQFAYQAGFIGVMIVAGLFGLIALGFGLGAWLGHPAWGFLAVTGLLMVVAFIIKWIGDRIKAAASTQDTYDLSVETNPAKLQQGKNGKAPEKLGVKDPTLLKTPQHESDNHGKDQ